MVIRKRSASIYSEKRINWDLRIVTSTEIAVGDDICLAYRDMQWEDFFEHWVAAEWVSESTADCRGRHWIVTLKW